jgi:CRP-like cAMP-binding protein
MPALPDELASIQLFESLTDDEREKVAGWFDLQEASPGVRLCGEGAAGYSFFVLLEGTATVTSDGAEIARLGRGDFFGELAILGDGRRTATVTATSPSRLLVLFGTEFRRLQQELPEAAAKLEAAAQQRSSNGQ